MGKVFETERDLKNEEIALKAFLNSSKLPYKYTKLPKFELDYMIHYKGNIVAFLEVKCYNINWKDYTYRAISNIKLNKMKKYKALAPVYIAFSHKDNILAFCEVSKLKGEEKMWGRKTVREGAPNDVELATFVPKEVFKTLKITQDEK